jgi:hypothetical protein
MLGNVYRGNVGRCLFDDNLFYGLKHPENYCVLFILLRNFLNFFILLVTKYLCSVRGNEENYALEECIYLQNGDNRRGSSQQKYILKQSVG